MFATSEPPRVDVAQLEMLSDAELTRMVKRGSDTALNVLLRRHRDPLYRFCLHLMRDPHDAEDICQESLARAIMRVDSLQSGAAFRGWLFSIARNLSVDSFRARKRVCPIPDEEITVLPTPLQQESPYGDVEVGEEYQTVAKALGRLKKNHQTVLMLREVEQLSYAEIARQLDVSESAVETLLFRARRRLREEYIRADAPAPVFGMIAVFVHRFTIPFRRYAPPFLKGAPVTAKVAITALAIGGAVVVTPHLAPVLHAAGGVLPASGHANHTVPGASRSSGATGVSTTQGAPSIAGAAGAGHASRHRAGRPPSGGTNSSPMGRTSGGSGTTGPGSSAAPVAHPGEPRKSGGLSRVPGWFAPFGGGLIMPSSSASSTNTHGSRGTVPPPGTSSIAAGGNSSFQGSSVSSGQSGRAQGPSTSMPAPGSAGSSKGKPPGGTGSTGASVQVTPTALLASSQAQATVAAAQTQVVTVPAQAQTSVAGLTTPAIPTVGAVQTQVGGAAGQTSTGALATVAAVKTTVAQAPGQVGGGAGKVKSTVPPVSKPTLVVTPVKKPTVVLPAPKPTVVVPPLPKPAVPTVSIPPVPTPAPLPIKP